MRIVIESSLTPAECRDRLNGVLINVPSSMFWGTWPDTSIRGSVSGEEVHVFGHTSIRGPQHHLVGTLTATKAGTRIDLSCAHGFGQNLARGFLFVLFVIGPIIRVIHEGYVVIKALRWELNVSSIKGEGAREAVVLLGFGLLMARLFLTCSPRFSHERLVEFLCKYTEGQMR